MVQQHLLAVYPDPDRQPDDRYCLPDGPYPSVPTSGQLTQPIQAHASSTPPQASRGSIPAYEPSVSRCSALARVWGKMQDLRPPRALRARAVGRQSSQSALWSGSRSVVFSPFTRFIEHGLKLNKRERLASTSEHAERSFPSAERRVATLCAAPARAYVLHPSHNRQLRHVCRHEGNLGTRRLSVGSSLVGDVQFSLFHRLDLSFRR